MYNFLCPKCNHSQKISRRQLKKKRNKVTCSECKLQFNARTILSKQTPQIQEPETLEPKVQIPEIPTLIKVRTQAAKETETINEPDIETYAWQEIKTAYHPGQWLIGIILGLILLVYQVYYFKGYALSQNPQTRPWLSTISSYINYPIPDYRKPLKFTTIGSSLDHSDKGHYRLQVSLINHANFRQAPPYIQLTLQNLYGGVFAKRTFSPQEYLGKTKSAMSINSSATLDIDFLIVIPDQEIGGYSIELK